MEALRAESDAGTAKIPPGPRTPGVLQTLEWMARPIPLMERCRRRYGRVFSLRLGPAESVVMIADPKLAMEVLTADATVFHAGDTNGVFRDVVGSNSILVLDGPEHLRHRRILLPVVGRHTARYREMIAEITATRVAQWRAGKEIKLLPEMEAISFEVIMRLSLGTDGTGEREAALRRLIPEMMDRCDSPLTLIPWFRHELGGVTPYASLMRFMGKVDEVIYDAIAERRRDPLLDLGEDALSLLLRATYDDGEPLPDHVIRDEILTMLMAGYETTTAGLTWALERLLRAPDKLDRLLSDLEAEDESYLDAVVKETLRRRPVIPIAARKAQVPVTLGDYHLPAGSVLIVAIYLIHSDPEIHPDPTEFVPERFIGHSAETGEFIPFGGGVRRCLGASLAQLEMKVVLRTVLERAVLRATGDGDEPVARRRFTLSPGREGSAVVERVASEGLSFPGSRRFTRPDRAGVTAPH